MCVRVPMLMFARVRVRGMRFAQGSSFSEGFGTIAEEVHGLWGGICRGRITAVLTHVLGRARGFAARHSSAGARGVVLSP